MAAARDHTQPADEAGRVAATHRHTRRGLAVSGMFAVAAVIAAFAPGRSGVWLPLHLFLVGSVTIAIATVTQMLAVTWSASPPPDDRLVGLQRWALAIGTVVTVASREWRSDLATTVGGALVACALASVAVVLLRVRRTARTPRFAPAIEAYVLALAGAMAGISIGVGLGAGTLPIETRNAHVLVNLYAFVGVVIAGTLPYFIATQARTKMTPRATATRLRAVSFTIWATAIAAAIAAAVRQHGAVSAALICYGIALVTLATLLPRARLKQVDWAGPRLLQLYAGIGWWVATTWWIAASYDATGIERAPLLALVIGGYAQIVAASFAYLVPVVRGGGHERLSAGFRRTRSWAGLVLGNLAAVLAILDQPTLMGATLAAWMIDAVLRTAISRF